MKRIPDEVSGVGRPRCRELGRARSGARLPSRLIYRPTTPTVLVVGRRTRTATPCRSSVTRTAWWLTMCSINVMSGHPG